MVIYYVIKYLCIILIRQDSTSATREMEPIVILYQKMNTCVFIYTPMKDTNCLKLLEMERI